MMSKYFCYRKHCYFVDLFVRVSNKVAVDMYNKLGYSVYRRVIEYYSGDVDEDAFGKFFKTLTNSILTIVWLVVGKFVGWYIS